jgi:phosphoglycolate phosphatase-like HAD superfamily hydrolase
MKKPFYVYVDVDETFLRNYGAKQMPIPTVIEHIKALKEEGAILYCWSSGGAEYAQRSAEKFGIEDCFTGFLPKPNVALDDMPFSKWHNLLEVHPNVCPSNTIESYKESIIQQQAKQHHKN